MYARYISETEIQFPTAEEFIGIPNWQEHETQLRKKHYMPLIGEATPIDGYTAEPIRFELVQQSETKTVPVEIEIDDYETDPDTGEQRKSGSHKEWRDTEIEADTSYIQILQWQYEKIAEILPTRFSKGTLLEALQGCNLYDEAREIYANDLDLQIAFAGFAEIDLEYPATKAIMQKYPEFFNETNVNALLNWIKENA